MRLASSNCRFQSVLSGLHEFAPAQQCVENTLDSMTECKVWLVRQRFCKVFGRRGAMR